MAKLHDLKTLIEARRLAQTPRKPVDGPDGAAARREVAASARPVHAPRPADTEGQGPDNVPKPRPANRNAPLPRRALASSKHAVGDVDLGEVFADVQRLRPYDRARMSHAAPSPVPRQRMADEAEALLASKYGAEPSPQRWDIGQELEAEQTFLRSGLGTDVLSKLRRGFWSLQGELDLHGATSDQARDQLAEFLLAARSRGARCVRVIHGKGLTSPGGEPVLKGKVRRWLLQWDDVLAYCEAPRHAGGGGAVLILLRGR